MNRLSSILTGLITAIAFFAFTQPTWAFCGFYVAKADTSLYNQASQVAIARQGDRTVLTMANDYQGDVQDFALVVPMPTILREEQVNVAATTILDRLDAFSAPRLVEYFDEDPCNQFFGFDEDISFADRPLGLSGGRAEAPSSEAALGVTIEASFSVGEYDILILSAEESNGLETWLRQNNYQIPLGASEVLGAYIRQGMKFFVAKVNLEAFDQAGYQRLRPLQMTYESPRFMLPIRLGMVNAQGPQELVVYLLTANGRGEVTNYRTVEMPSNLDIPVFLKDEFGQFYTDMFQHGYDQEGRNVAFLEYAWDMGNCDPCAATPLSPEELRQAGVFWLNDPALNAPRIFRNAGVFITRLHARYTREKFPEDLMFQETNNRRLFQGRYVMNHPFVAANEQSCVARVIGPALSENPESPETEEVQSLRRRIREVHRDYLFRTLPDRFERESQNLARLTGWSLNEIRQRISDEVPQPRPSGWQILYPPRTRLGEIRP